MNKNQQEYQTPSYTGISEQFYHEVIAGLSTEFKQLPSKYFYDELGDSLFQKIMNCQDYYLTRCETEIFQEQTGQLADVIVKGGEFDLIELGVGDGTKTMLLLNHLIGQGSNFRYMPIDISGNILAELEGSLRQQTPDLETMCPEGDISNLFR